MKDSLQEADRVSISTPTPSLQPEDEQMIDHVVELCKSYERQGLDSRWTIGAELNKRLGSPEERQPLGLAVLKKASERSGVSESEFSRMRWFAHLFASLADFAAKHPEVSSWTSFKELLPDLKPKQGEGAKRQRSAERTSKAFVATFVRSLETATGKLPLKAIKPEEAERVEVSKVIKKLVASVNKLFRMGITIKA